jgi:hypothetical protein
LKVNEGVVVDYSTFEKAERAGFSPEALVDDDYEACQKEARRLFSLGAGGVLSPSAALPGSVNLTLFGQRVPIRWNAQVQISAAVPVQALATGQPASGLVSRVRYRDQQHPDLLSYLGRGPGRHARR